MAAPERSNVGSTRAFDTTMAQIQPLARAPIIEALIDLRVHVPDGTSVEHLEKSLEGRELGYKKVGPILRGSFGIAINLQETPPLRQMPNQTTIIGVRLHSADEKYVAQFTTEGFTLSRLTPYESWDALILEAKRMWGHYQACVSPIRVHRTAVRFINNLRLPLKQGERFEKFLTGLPVMPADFPQAISSFLQRFVVHDEPSGATAILTQALEQFTDREPVPVILDIDVFRETKFAPDSQELWNYLNGLRSLKNRFFFGALTDQALELYR